MHDARPIYTEIQYHRKFNRHLHFRSLTIVNLEVSFASDVGYTAANYCVVILVTNAHLELSDLIMPRTTLHAFVKRGKNVGEFLYPHRHVDGKYVVSATRFKRDYIRLESVEDVLAWLEKGYSVRMSNPAKGITAASLIGPESIFKTTTS